MCSIDPYDLNPCDVWRETPRRARKKHRCSSCRRAIQPGEAYLDHFSLSEGEPVREKACFECWLAREEFCGAHGVSTNPSYFSQLLNECIDGGDESERWAPMLQALRTQHGHAARSA